METQSTVTRANDARNGRSPLGATYALAPAADIFENADEILLLLDLPGVERENVTIDVQNNELRLRAKRVATADAEPSLREWATRTYARTFRVSEGIDVEKISAELTDGVLRLRLPKAAALKTRRVEVRSG